MAFFTPPEPAFRALFSGEMAPTPFDPFFTPFTMRCRRKTFHSEIRGNFRVASGCVYTSNGIREIPSRWDTTDERARERVSPINKRNGIFDSPFHLFFMLSTSTTTPPPPTHRAFLSSVSIGMNFSSVADFFTQTLIRLPSEACWLIACLLAWPSRCWWQPFGRAKSF